MRPEHREKSKGKGTCEYDCLDVAKNEKLCIKEVLTHLKAPPYPQRLLRAELHIP